MHSKLGADKMIQHCKIKTLFLLSMLLCITDVSSEENETTSSLHPTGFENVIKFSKEELRQKYTHLARKHSVFNDASLLATLRSLKPIIAKQYGKKSKEYIQLLISFWLADTEVTNGEVFDNARKAIAIAQSYQETEPGLYEYVSMHLIGRYRRGLYAPNKALALLHSAKEFYQKNHPDNSQGLVDANYYLALLHANIGFRYQRKYINQNKAKVHFKLGSELVEENLEIFADWRGPTHESELLTRSAFIFLLEKTGQHDKAAEQCVLVGSMSPWSDTLEQKPLLRVTPVFPHRKLFRGQKGSVTLEFTVSVNGSVKNIEVLKSIGGAAFEESSIIALKKWRYAPKFKDGAPIEARTQVELSFELR